MDWHLNCALSDQVAWILGLVSYVFGNVTFTVYKWRLGVAVSASLVSSLKSKVEVADVLRAKDTEK